MKKEVFRMERITCIEHGVIKLEDFNLNVFEGEILGLVPINSHGMTAFLTLLHTNLPLYDGYVYCNEIMVNSWKSSMAGDNRVTIINESVGLVEGLTVVDNIFVLRQNFNKEYIKPLELSSHLEPFFKEIDVNIEAGAYIEKLSVFERVVVELLRGIIAGHKLIVFNELETILTSSELKRMHEIIKHYTRQGVSFLYICSHFEVIMEVCDRVSLFSNGRIEKTLRSGEMRIENFTTLTSDYTKLIRQYLEHKNEDSRVGEIVGEIKYQFQKYSETVNVQIGKAECIVIQCMDNEMYYELRDRIVINEKEEGSFVELNGKPIRFNRNREIAVIPELAAQTMIFPQLNYIDNLCFNLDSRMSGVWLRSNIKRSIRKEYGEIIEDQTFDMRITDLSEKQKYQLVYIRVLLQKPKIVFCVQPFQGADMEHRMYIWKLLEKLLDQGISVVILAINLGDTLSIADRLVLINDKCNVYELHRNDFSVLPSLVPWQHLYKENNDKENNNK